MKIAVFAGTFDPPTLAHQEIIQRAASLCSRLYIAVAAKGKGKNLLSQQDRIDFLQKLTKEWSNVEIVPLNGLVVDLAQEHQADILIRSLRNAADLDYEMQMAAANRQMSGIETLFLMASPQYSQISSSLVREIASYGKKLTGLVSPNIEAEILQKLSTKMHQGNTSSY
jgi:pantetheine-phosphate adenylyltransferase